MKGVALRAVILLVVAVMVIAVALYFLVFVTSFDSLFLSNDQRILKQYATCVLAYCAAGAGSDEVNAVGCLKYESGKCVLSCAQVEEDVYIKNGISATVTEVGGRGAPHYCGPDAALEFEFSGLIFTGFVPFESGQMDKIATKPEWVCKPVKIPFIGVELDSLGIPTTDIQHGGILGAPQNCIILSGKVSPILSAREGCFMPIKYDKSYDNIYFTPLIEYDDPKQIIYPSAIYVDRSFAEPVEWPLEPECDYRNPPNHGPVSEQEITDKIKGIINSPAVIEGKQIDMTYQQYYDELGKQGKIEEQKKLADTLVENYLGDPSSSGNNLIGNVLNKCNFRTSHRGEKIKYHVWAKPVYPTIDALKDFAKIGNLQNFIAGLLGSASPDLQNAFLYVTTAGEEGTKLIFSQLGGSCTAVVLGRDLKIETSDQVPETENEIASGRILEADTDEESYTGGETIKLRGKVEKTSDPEEEIDAELIWKNPLFGSVFVYSGNIPVNEDGSFEWEYKLGERVAAGKWEIAIEYGTDKKEIEFAVI